MTSPPGNRDDSGSAAEPRPLVCARCAARAEEPQPTWTFSVEDGVRRHYCDACSRENLRAIEGRLDSAWW